MERKMLNGYWIVYVPDHPGAMHNNSHNGWEYEHRYVMECKLGRLLTSDETIHHVDGNKLNNDESNLRVLTRSEHTTQHAIEDGMHIWSHKCCDCGAPIYCGAIRCRECNAKYQKARVERQMKASHPTKEQLEECIKTMTNRDIARKYGVSDTAVRKWRVKYGLPSAREYAASMAVRS